MAAYDFALLLQTKSASHVIVLPRLSGEVPVRAEGVFLSGNALPEAVPPLRHFVTPPPLCGARKSKVVDAFWCKLDLP